MFKPAMEDTKTVYMGGRSIAITLRTTWTYVQMDPPRWDQSQIAAARNSTPFCQLRLDSYIGLIGRIYKVKNCHFASLQ